MNKKLSAILFLFIFASYCFGTMQFDGVNDYIVSPTLVAQNHVTYSAWINPTAFSAFSAVMANYNFTDGFLIDLGSVDNRIRWRGVITSGFTIEVAASGNWSTTTGWHHVAGTFNGATAKLYYDGDLVGSASGSGTLTSRPIYIGARNNATSIGSFLTGFIDDVRVYDRALSDSEVQSIAFSRSRLNPTDDIALYWRMDEGFETQIASSTCVLDRSGKENHGFAHNGPVYQTSILNYP